MKKKMKKISLDKRLLEMMYDGFVRCPTTGRVIEVLTGDDKVICGCGKSNPKCLLEQNERTHTHIVYFMGRATVDDFIHQEEEE